MSVGARENMKWEYLSVKRLSFNSARVAWMVNGKEDDTLQNSSETDVLNKFGADGWELTAFHHENIEVDGDLEEYTARVPTGAASYYLKRPAVVGL